LGLFLFCSRITALIFFFPAYIAMVRVLKLQPFIFIDYFNYL